VLEGGEFVKAAGDMLVRYLERPVKSSTLILRLGSLDRRTKVARAIEERALVVECGRLRWSDARQWIEAECRARGMRIDRSAVNGLLEVVGPNVMALGNELDKLCTYVGDRDRITGADVEEMAVQARVQSVFELAGAVAEGRTGDALRLCRDLLLRGERREGLIGVLAGQVRQLWQIKRLAREGKNARSIAGAIRRPGWVVEKSLATARRLPQQWFAESLRILADADHESKTTSIRTGEEEVWLEKTLARLSSI
jgi:DNA polymerase-3 subunit delta